MNKLLIIISIIVFNTVVFSQQEKSIHQIESEFYQKHPELVGKEEIFRTTPRTDLENIESLSHKIYGFHPYWISDATASNYYYSLLTHVAYFSAEVDNSISTTGGFSTTRNWATTQLVNYCKNNGIKIHLTITLFSNHSNVLSNATTRTNLVNNIISQLNLRNADGANIDFESIPSSQKNNFKSFIFELGTVLKANNLDLVVELPAVDWNNIFDNSFFTTVNSVVDYYFLMAYDYYWKGSLTAGPISPLTTGTSIHHVTRSISTYYSVGVPLSKLIVGLNYYGYEWPVTNSSRMATATGDGVTKTFSQIKTALNSIPIGDKFFDVTYNSPWYRYQSSSQWYQTWYDDSLSLSMKYDSIKARNCAGTGMWALSYDGSNTDLWGALKNSFASSSEPTSTILANFETDIGIFNRQPTYSGSTVGISTSSSSERVVEQAYNGWASLKVVLIDNTTTTNNWTVRLLSGDGNPSNNQTLNSTGYIGFWLKTSSAPIGAQIAITIDDGAGGTELSPKIDIINNGEWNLYQWNLQGSGWTNFFGGNGVINGPSATLDAIMFYAPNNSSNWTFYIDDVSYNSTSPLPVELSTLYAISLDKTIKLFWQTISEKNNYGFEVERSYIISTNNNSIINSWEKIGFITGHGNSNSLKNYNFIDDNPKIGKNFYRLKQIDFNGNFTYSHIVEIDFNVKNLSEFILYQNYPNPFNPITKISWYSPISGWQTIKVFDILGNEIVTLLDEYKETGYHSIDFNIDNLELELSSGIYLYQLRIVNPGSNSDNSLILTRKMVIMK